MLTTAELNTCATTIAMGQVILETNNHSHNSNDIHNHKNNWQQKIALKNIKEHCVSYLYESLACVSYHNILLHVAYIYIYIYPVETHLSVVIVVVCHVWTFANNATFVSCSFYFSVRVSLQFHPK